MSIRRLPLIAVTAVALAVAAPAAAISAYPLVGALHATTLTAAKTTSAGRHTIPPVACEQPPRSEVVLPSLKQATANALALFG